MNLLRTSLILGEIHEVIAADAGVAERRIANLHVWRVGKRACACGRAGDKLDL